LTVGGDKKSGKNQYDRGVAMEDVEEKGNGCAGGGVLGDSFRERGITWA